MTAVRYVITFMRMSLWTSLSTYIVFSQTYSETSSVEKRDSEIANIAVYISVYHL